MIPYIGFNVMITGLIVVRARLRVRLDAAAAHAPSCAVTLKATTTVGSLRGGPLSWRSVPTADAVV